MIVLNILCGSWAFSASSVTGPTIPSTATPNSRWNEIIPDKVLVNALVDRLTHKAKIINMTGSSYRLKQTQQMIKNQIRVMTRSSYLINFTRSLGWPIFE
nr:ATP-binding protein [uncultured Rikenella sp.]